MADRYAVYPRDLSPEVRELLGDDRQSFVVWDRTLKKSVPFGCYGNVNDAQRRAYQMNNPTGWHTGEHRLCLACADAHMTGETNRAGWRPVQGNILYHCDWCGTDLLRTDKRVKSCGAIYDHGPHVHVLRTTELRCPGNGPFRDREMAKLEPRTYPGPPCVCSDSVRSAVGDCPPVGDREYGHCPVRTGSLKRETEER